MKKRLKSALAALLTVLLLAAAAPAALGAQTQYATRGQVADMLLEAADSYNPGVKRTDIIQGYADGTTHEGQYVTRAQALVMLERAFGKLPAPKGDNARSGYSASNFTDVPAWAKKELENVFSSGIVAGTSATTFSPNNKVTMHQMELFIRRTYALEGTNLKDDFYATVNKTALDSSTILPGYSGTGSFYDLSIKVNKDVASLIREAAASPKTEGEKKISALYNNILNVSARNKAGITPIKSYLDALDSAKNLEELMEVHQKIYKDLGCSLLLGFGLSVDAKDSTVYDLTFSTTGATLGSSGYSGATAKQKKAYLTYIETLMKLLGRKDGATEAQVLWKTEAAIAAKSLSTQDYNDVDKTYHLYTMAQLQALFPNVNLTELFDLTGLKQTDKIKVMDVGEMKAVAVLFDNAHLETLKTMCRAALASSYGVCFNQEFSDAQDQFSQAYMGTTGSLSTEETAAQYVQNLMSEYLGEAYASRYFSAKAKADVEQMVQEILSIYKERINNLTWMSSSTKAKAILKLESMKIKIGYPNHWKTYLDNAQILTSAEGGSFFNNLVAITKAYQADAPQMQKEGPDKDEFGMSCYTVNAQYNPTSNSIEFPAGILQPPFYDVNASYEKNLGGIGYVIAHEITHAFDNNGAKYDEKGNASNWWTAEDYAAFQKLCQKVVAMYDGKEAAPGITCNGELTLSEDIADLGSMACITELEGKRANPDYKALYTAAAQIWCSSYPRAMKAYLSQVDVHAPDKLRGSLVMQQFQQFYDAFGITEGDGMWIAPENRVSIW